MGQLYLSHGNQLLSAGGVDGDNRIEILLRGTHLNGDTETLQNLGAVLAENVQAYNLLLLAGAHQLVLGGALVLGLHHRVVHGGELALVDFDVLVAKLLTGFGLGETNGADLGVREDD